MSDNDRWLAKREEVQSFIDLIFSEKGDEFVNEWRKIKSKYDQREVVLDHIRGSGDSKGNMRGR